MTMFAIEVTLVLLLAYIVGCAAGCWLQRACSRRDG